MLLKSIKNSMRISHDASDSEILDNIEICKLDLEMAGVYCEEQDRLYQKACELYAKWQQDYMGKGERFEKSYRSLKDAMALCGEYNVRPDN